MSIPEGRSERDQDRGARRWAARMVVALCVVGAGLVPVGPGGGQPAPPPPGETHTWSVRPTPWEGEPERHNYSYALDAGATVSDGIRVRNIGDEPLALVVYATDALVTAQGVLDLLPAAAEPTGVGAWMTLEAGTVDVPPGQVVDVPFTLAVPAGTAGGDYAGGIVTSLRSEALDETGRPVLLDRRLGSRMHIRVAGELRPAVEVSEVTARYSGSLNPVGSGTLHVSYRVTNTGNVRLAGAQKVRVEGPGGLFGQEADLDPLPELLPGSSLDLALDLPGVRPAFRHAVTVEVRPVPTREGDRFAADVAVGRAATRVWAVPWSLLVALLVLVGGPWARRRAARRRARAESERIDAAVAAALAADPASARREGEHVPDDR